MSRSLESIVASGPAFLEEAALVALAVGAGLAAGAALGKRTQKAFLFGRLLERVAEQDREAVLDLLAPSQLSPSPGHEPRDGRPGHASTVPTE